MREPRPSLYFSGQAIGLMVLPLLFTACTSTGEVAVKVDSISHQVVPITGKRLLVDLNEGAGNLFRENEIATKIMHTLAARGYAQATTLADADYRLEFSYGFQKLQKPLGNGPAILVGMGMGTTPRYKGQLTLQVFSVSNPSQPLWVGEANGSQQSSDMHSMIDYLIAAAVNHLGEHMSRPVSYTFSETDPVSTGTIPLSDE
jgi:hypothetical protein